MIIVAIHKKTRAEKILAENLTEEQAWSFCEAWGWTYCDERLQSFWLEIR